MMHGGMTLDGFNFQKGISAPGKQKTANVNETWTSKFQPLMLTSTGPFNYMSGGAKVPIALEMNYPKSSQNFEHSANNFYDRRKKTADSQ